MITPITLDTPFMPIAERVRAYAQFQPDRPALDDGRDALSYGQLDAWMDRVAAALQAAAVHPGEAIALCADTSVFYAATYLGALRAGVVVAPLAPSSTPETLCTMAKDAQARYVFIDASTAHAFADLATPQVNLGVIPVEGAMPAKDWLAPEGVAPKAVTVEPDWAFNIIYSSGTTGTPKGIVQSHGMRWAHVRRGSRYGYSTDTVTLLATPLYSNTTLVVFFPTLASGGTALLMSKFNTKGYLQWAQSRRVTHTMLVPVQYQRLLADPDFGDYDLSSFQAKFCTSAPFRAELKRDTLDRWPGGLIEFYGMTEGGASFILNAHEHPDKLHTVGQVAPGCEVRIIDEDGRALPMDAVGEVAGHSAGMMLGYHRQPEKTREAEWFDEHGKRYIRTGDIGQLDADGFLTLMDRRKDMIISGGFNIYPSDIEAQLRQYPGVADVAVVGVPSNEWGETPVAFVVSGSSDLDEDALRHWYNDRTGKTQRLSAVKVIAELPRSAIGKVLKRELRDQFVQLSKP